LEVYTSYVKQVIIELDDATAERLERVAPSRKRKRSEFIRAAILRALDEMAEAEMERAYRARPDDPGDAYLDVEAWDPNPWRAAPSGKRRRRR
jgi:predicted DNA-binding protein